MGMWAVILTIVGEHCAGSAGVRGSNPSVDAVQQWLNAPIHRSAILDPFIQHVGVADIDSTAVMDLAGDASASQSINHQSYVYPYNGQTNVPVGFAGNGVPNPLAFMAYQIQVTQLRSTSHRVQVLLWYLVSTPLYLKIVRTCSPCFWNIRYVLSKTSITPR